MHIWTKLPEVLEMDTIMTFKKTLGQIQALGRQGIWGRCRRETSSVRQLGQNTIL